MSLEQSGVWVVDSSTITYKRHGCAHMNSIHQLRTWAILLLIDSKTVGIDVDEAVGLTIILVVAHHATVARGPVQAACG